MSTDHEMLKTVYAAFNNRDIEVVLSAMHPEVDWPNGWEGGRVYGHQGIRDYWTRQWAAINPHVEPIDFVTDDSGRTIVKVHAVIRDLNGAITFDGVIEHIYFFQDDLIKKMEIEKP